MSRTLEIKEQPCAKRVRDTFLPAVAGLIYEFFEIYIESSIEHRSFRFENINYDTTKAKMTIEIEAQRKEIASKAVGYGLSLA